MAGHQGVVVSGGREAGTATAMIGFILEQSGRDPSVLLGTPSPQLGGWSRRGSGTDFVAEWSGPPEDLETFPIALAVLLNVGSDPWVNFAPWSETLGRSLRVLPAGSSVLALGHPSMFEGDIESRGRIRDFQWASLQQGADWWGTDLREESGRFRFRVFHRGRYVIEARLQIPGIRAVVAALAAVAACDRLGISASTIRHGLEEFSGLSREFEIKGSYRGVTLVDDEADDPASIREAMVQARRQFGDRRLWAVYSAQGIDDARRYLAAFSAADRILITDRESIGRCGMLSGSPGGSPSRFLTQTLIDAGLQAGRTGNLVETISVLDRHLEPGDVLLTLGAGDVGTIADAFIRRLPRDRQGG